MYNMPDKRYEAERADDQSSETAESRRKQILRAAEILPNCGKLPECPGKSAEEFL